MKNIKIREGKAKSQQRLEGRSQNEIKYYPDITLLALSILQKQHPRAKGFKNKILGKQFSSQAQEKKYCIWLIHLGLRYKTV